MIVVVGNAARNVVLEVERLPVEGETLPVLAVRETIGGKGLNQAVAAARAGAAVQLVARIGDDAAGAAIRARLASERIDASRIVVDAQPTNCAWVTLAPGGENHIVSHYAPAACLAAAAAATLADRGAARRLVLQGNVEPVVRDAAISAARRAGIPIQLNAAAMRWPLHEVAAVLDTIIVNAAEALALTGSAEPGEAARALAEGGRTAIVTLGGTGLVLADAGTVTRLAAPSVEACDTVGAGDVLCGAFAAHRVAGLSADAAADLAMRAASLSVARRGVLDSFPTREEFARLR